MEDCCSPFFIRDLMLGELLCQAGWLTDAQLLKATITARSSQTTVADSLIESGWFSRKEISLATRILNRYLRNPNAMDYFLVKLKKVRDRIQPQLHGHGSTC